MAKRGSGFQVLTSLSFFALGMLTGVLLFTFFKAGTIYDYTDTLDGAYLPPSDAIVVLAGGRGRIAAAGDFWFRYFEREEAGQIEAAPFLYISGMGPNSNWASFAHSIRPGILKAMKPSNVVLETESRNTEENALWVVKNARLRGWKRIILMTSPYHMRRSRYIFGKVLDEAGLKLEVDSLTIYQEAFSSEEWRDSLNGIRVTMYEYLKWLYYTTFWRPEGAPA
ncbi:MAG: YdcF family protein [Bdellovibrionales bacterium]|nr:YdcF family protein [Bdellovibrionales bacterium]